MFIRSYNSAKARLADALIFLVATPSSCFFAVHPLRHQSKNHIQLQSFYFLLKKQCCTSLVVLADQLADIIFAMALICLTLFINMRDDHIWML